MPETNKIRDILGIPELLTGLAEEASELAQAALKYRRSLTQINPTPIPEDEAYQALLEEIADVNLYLSTLYINYGEVCRIMEAKGKRWEKRLSEVQRG